MGWLPPGYVLFFHNEASKEASMDGLLFGDKFRGGGLPSGTANRVLEIPGSANFS